MGLQVRVKELKTQLKINQQEGIGFDKLTQIAIVELKKKRLSFSRHAKHVMPLLIPTTLTLGFVLRDEIKKFDQSKYKWEKEQDETKTKNQEKQREKTPK